ncbi:hypothetical protein ACHAQA_006205 [Verticillium albo-atrum]
MAKSTHKMMTRGKKPLFELLRRELLPFLESDSANFADVMDSAYSYNEGEGEDEASIGNFTSPEYEEAMARFTDNMASDTDIDYGYADNMAFADNDQYVFGNNANTGAMAPDAMALAANSQPNNVIHDNGNPFALAPNDQYVYGNNTNTAAMAPGPMALAANGQPSNVIHDNGNPFASAPNDQHVYGNNTNTGAMAPGPMVPGPMALAANGQPSNVIRDNNNPFASAPNDQHVYGNNTNTGAMAPGPMVPGPVVPGPMVPGPMVPGPMALAANNQPNNVIPDNSNNMVAAINHGNAGNVAGHIAPSAAAAGQQAASSANNKGLWDCNLCLSQRFRNVPRVDRHPRDKCRVPLSDLRNMIKHFAMMHFEFSEAERCAELANCIEANHAVFSTWIRKQMMVNGQDASHNIHYVMDHLRSTKVMPASLLVCANCSFKLAP